MGKWKPLKGVKFGRLTVIDDYRDNSQPKGKKHWCVCKCDCGKDNVYIRASELSRGHKLSCGCRHMDTHGLLHSRFYGIFYHVVQRCNNPNNDRYHRYGGRGIKCLWNTFQEFYDDMYESYQEHFEEHSGDTTIDRIDNDGNYCKENCRWLTNKEQQANKCTTTGLWSNGNLYSLKSFCDTFKLPYQRIKYKAKTSNIDVLDVLRQEGVLFEQT